MLVHFVSLVLQLLPLEILQVFLLWLSGLRIHEDAGSIPGFSELGIQCCHELWCRSQTRLGSLWLWLWCRTMATALIRPLAPGTSICHWCGPEKTKKIFLNSLDNSFAYLLSVLGLLYPLYNLKCVLEGTVDYSGNFLPGPSPRQSINKPALLSFFKTPISVLFSWPHCTSPVQLPPIPHPRFLGPHPWHMKVPRLGSNQSYSYQPTPQSQPFRIQAGSVTSWHRGQGSNLHPHGCKSSS